MAGEEQQQAAQPAPPRPGRGRRAFHAACRVLAHCLQLTLGLITLALLIAGLLWFRLEQGPVRLPFVAGAAERLFNAGSDRLRAEVSEVVLTLGERGAPSGIQFTDVRLAYASGEPLFAIPRLAARFDIADLVQGRLRPIRVTVIRPEARIVRTAEGAFRFGLGAVPPGGTAPLATGAGAPQSEAIARLLDELAGDAPPPPELSRLEEVRIVNARLTFENLRAGRRWTTRQADLRLWRAADGLRARMEVGLVAGGEAGAGAAVTAHRPRGDQAAHIEARLENLRPEHLAEQLEQLAWLRLFDTRLDGRLAMTIHPDGRIEGLEGRIEAGAGRLRALGRRGHPFDSMTLAFAYQAGRERMRITEFNLAAPAAEARLSGFADLLRGAGGRVTGLAGQFQVAGLRAAVPRVFADPVSFDDGQIVARLELDPLRVEVARSHLRDGDLVVEVEGEARAGRDGWQTQLRAAGRQMTIDQLVRFWPHVAAGKARAWVEKNMRAGRIDRFVAHMRFAGGKPRVNLDFTYSGLESSYLKEMTPIVAASGRGSLTLERFDMTMESGEVHAVEGAPVRLDGSRLTIPDLEAKPTMAEITLRGRGPTASVLTLINQEPLRLTSKLGLDPASVGGAADVTAHLGFPLIDELKLDGVAVEAEAALADLAMPFELPGGHVADVQSDEVALSANPQRMRVTGPIRVDGTPLRLDWTEYFDRGRDQREIALAGAVTPDFLARLDLDTAYFAGGAAEIRLRLSQTGSPDFAFDLEADLGPARLRVAEFDWQKPPGPAGTLVAEGSFGDGIRVPDFRLDSEELKAAGAITFGPGGRMQSASVSRLRFRGLADVALEAARRSDGGLALTVGGRRLDLALFEGGEDDGAGGGEGGEGGEGGGRTPLAVDFSLDELAITPKIVARPAIGSYSRDAAGHAVAELEGALAEGAPFTAEYDRPPGEPASVTVRSEAAGAVLNAAGLFGGAEGGQLRLKARLAPEEGVDMAGAARIKDVRIRSGGTFRSILAEGGAEEAARAAETGGLAFDRVDVPFEYRDGVMVLGESVARGNLLAVKVEGTVNETTDTVDLVGVISPVYGLTGALDSIPLLGTLLSGGKGEGILAMTFSVTGPMQNPEFSVNPLSLLAPGILRNIFSGRTAEPDPRFLEQLEREN